MTALELDHRRVAFNAEKKQAHLNELKTELLNTIEMVNHEGEDLYNFRKQFAQEILRHETIHYYLLRQELTRSFANDYVDRVITKDFTDLFSITIPCGDLCPLNLFEPLSCHVDRESSTFGFHMSAKKLDPEEKVVEADPFILYKHVDGRQCTTSYTGDMKL